jgi:hypothetical protein
MRTASYPRSTTPTAHVQSSSSFQPRCWQNRPPGRSHYQHWNVFASHHFPCRFTILPNEFLGGATPTYRRLRHIGLKRVLLYNSSFQQAAISSVSWSRHHPCEEGFISPNALAAALSATTRLKSLVLKLPIKKTHPERAGTHSESTPPDPIVLPALTYFDFGRYKVTWKTCCPECSYLFSNPSRYASLSYVICPYLFGNCPTTFPG